MSIQSKTNLHNSKTLVLSVGGTTEPIKKSIAIKKPDILVFFTSPGSQSEAEGIVAGLEDSIRPQPESIHFFTTPDEQDLVASFATVEELFQKIQEWDPTKENTIVDYTGGTKVMSSALVTGALLRGFDKLSYVGGKDRTKEGLGIVVSGTELPLLSRNPIRLQGYFELNKLSELYRKHEYSACVEICREAKNSDWIEDKELFQDLESVFLYYHRRDLFDFGQAYSSLNKKFKDPGNFSRYPIGVQKFIRESYLGRMGMGELATVSKEFKSYQSEWEKDPSNPPSMKKLQNLNVNLLLTEIYLNAEKRAEQGKYDDAVLRHYRLLEMTAQLQLLLQHGIYNSYTLPEQIPEFIREEFISRFRFLYTKLVPCSISETIPKSGSDSNVESNSEPDFETNSEPLTIQLEFLKYGMEASFRILRELNDPKADFYNPTNKEKDSSMDLFQKIQSSRNLSILAHGLAPIGEETYTKLKRALENWNLIPDAKSLRQPEFVVDGV